METKKCLYCNGEITGKREDAKFCSNTCKAKHWEETRPSNKASLPVVQEEKNVISQLRGISGCNENINSNTGKTNTSVTIYKTVEVAAGNPERLRLGKEQRRLTDVRKQLESEVRSLQDNLKQISSQDGNIWVVGFTGAGAFLGNKNSENKTEGTIFGGLAGFVTGKVLKAVTQDIREEDKKQQAEKILIEAQNKIILIHDTDKALSILNEKLKVTPFFIKEKKQIPVIEKKEIKTIDLSINPEVKECAEPSAGLQTDVSDVSLTDIGSDKIVNSQKLKLMKFTTLPFQGKWSMFFGIPSYNFYCLLFGMPGEGKSTFAIQFAKYLSENIGRVVYISSEEGLSKTLTDKFMNNHAESKYLDVADLRTFEDILRVVQPETYNFIFIDSLDDMRIDVDKMKKIRLQYKNSAIISISQSTKDGKVRGSNELVHDCDIAVKVENGIASTTKNRFKERGMTYDVF